MQGLATLAVTKLRRPDLIVRHSYVNGRWTEGGDTVEVEDPATGDVISVIHVSDVSVADCAVDAAHAAFPNWRGMHPLMRGARLRRWAKLIRDNIDDLATILTAEQGKPLREACGEIEYAVSFLDWFAAEGERAYGETIPSHLPNSQLSVFREPVGIVAAVTPWNFPCAMIARKAGAALAAGCPIIVKPAPETPLIAGALAKLSLEAEIPNGVFSVILGDGALLTSRLLERPEVRAVSFTGSTEIGCKLLSMSASGVKRASLELGGNAPFIIFADVSVADAVKSCLAAKFVTSGQDCLAANRIYVQRRNYDAFVEAFASATSNLRIGHGLDPQTQIGPMTKQSGLKKCVHHIRSAVDGGAQVVTGGTFGSPGANFLTPTVLANATDEMAIAREEIFGPVAALLPFDDEDEVLVRANDTEYGLAAYLYTNDLGRALRLTDGLEYGMVAVNTTRFTGAPIPFGGRKMSGLGREGSRHGINEFMELKYVCFARAST